MRNGLGRSQKKEWGMSVIKTHHMYMSNSQRIIRTSLCNEKKGYSERFSNWEGVLFYQVPFPKSSHGHSRERKMEEVDGKG